MDAAFQDQAWKLGRDLVGQYVHGNGAITDRAVMWALLCHSTRVSRLAFRSPPRSGFPAMSSGAAMAADEVTAWHKAAAYLRGELDEVEGVVCRMPAPSALEISTCDLVLRVYHHNALRSAPDWRRLRVAIYMRACGSPPRRVCHEIGINRHRLRHAQDAAMDDMLWAWGK